MCPNTFFKSWRPSPHLAGMNCPKTPCLLSVQNLEPNWLDDLTRFKSLLNHKASGTPAQSFSFIAFPVSQGCRKDKRREQTIVHPSGSLVPFLRLFARIPNGATPELLEHHNNHFIPNPFTNDHYHENLLSLTPTQNRQV